MNTDFAKLTAGVLLAQTPQLAVPAGRQDDPVVQYGLVGLIAWMVVRESFSLIRLLLDRKARRLNGGCGDHDEMVRVRVELEALKERVEKLEE
ncbi:MAG: hypothetical protein HRF50_17525 [Phycisphaerae bacterium]|jgi:hypothetical protein